MTKPSYKELETQLLILQAEVKVLHQIIDKFLTTTPKSSPHPDPMLPKLKQLTSKQQAALQMLLLGAQNREIARRFGVTDSTAKVYVSGIMRKLGATNRTQIVRLISDTFDAINPEEYELHAGIPKDWAKNYQDYPAVNAKIFEKTRGQKR